MVCVFGCARKPLPDAECLSQGAATKTIGSDRLQSKTQPSQRGLRTWKDATGLYKTEAVLIGVKDHKVQLRKADGAQVIVPMERLSEDDRSYVNGDFSRLASYAGKR